MQGQLALLFFFSSEVANLPAIDVTAKAPPSTLYSLHDRKMFMPVCRLLFFFETYFFTERLLMRRKESNETNKNFLELLF